MKQIAIRLMLATATLGLGACSSVASLQPEPWVKPYERHLLADPIMRFDRDPIASAYLHHVYESREGARGALGSGGGGCGCN